MAHYRSAHPASPGAIAPTSLPGHHSLAAAPHHGHPHVAGSTATKYAIPGKSAAARAAAAPEVNAIASVLGFVGVSVSPDVLYVWCYEFNVVKLHDGFIKAFSKDPHFDTAAIPHMELLVRFMAADPKITDIRWMAYMLATAYWETTSLKKEMVPVLDKHHKPMFDKKTKKPLVRSRHRWRITMSPVAEVGHGAHRRYHLPVKVELQPKGDALVTEEDGDQFTVTASGHVKAVNKGAKMGAPATQKATAGYAGARGDAFAYYGRGYVQLTWWSNYAKSSVELGLGLQLLLNPDDVLEPQTAYRLMAHGMRTGEGFANGHKLSHYFHGSKTDYLHARHMVNGHDHAVEIASIAKKFETVLVAAKF